ncbi:insulinase family protein [Thalassomonas viridans]|uniref:Protease 3 n=1 Tax=Thalassomonas viridans TaxID=137584 RepID=A0AAE9YZX5_9GAMM|nr:insulinase family protein [Thalassomonas viridans]WDE03667.1 insulinase family protein [Thalassomonas viridans]
MKKILGLSVLAIAVLSGCNTTSQSSSSAPQVSAALLSDTFITSPNDNRSYQTLKLDNQIEVVLVSDPSAEKSAAALSVGVGLLHDPMSQQGMAHYLEHMLFLGTERYPDTKGYSEFMAKNGGAHNAYTWLDVTNYMFKVNNDAFDEGLDRFSDFFKAPKLYPEYTDKEKNAVNAEWSMRREMDFFGQFKLTRKMMGDHPANRFLIGNLETLGDKEGSQLHQETVDFYNRYYSANIMKVALISNLPIEEMTALAKKHFSSIKNKNINKPSVSKKLDMTEAGSKRVFYKPNEDVKQLKLEFTIENNLKDFAVKPNNFVSYLLSSEMPGSPAQLLRDKGWVSQLTADASPNLYGNYGTLNIDIELTDAGMQQREKIVATVMQYIKLIKAQGVDEKYFSEISTSLNNQFTFLEKTDEFNYVSQLAANMQDYPVNHAINAPYHYAKFDAAAVNRVLDQLSPQTLKIWYVSQQEETDSKLHFYDGEYRISDISQAEIDSWNKPSDLALSLPAVNRMLPENFTLKTDKLAKQTQPELAYDKDGIKIWRFASQEFSSQPKGLLEVYFNNPKAESDIYTSVALTIWADIYNLQQSALSTEAAIAGMGLNVSPGNGVILTLNGFTDKQNSLLQQAVSRLRVKTDEQGFNQAIDRYIRNLNNAGKQFPFYQAFDELNKLTRSGNHSNEQLIKTAKVLTLGDFERIMDEVLKNNQLRAFAFGNYDQADIASVAKQLADALPKVHHETAYSRDKYWKPVPGEVLVLKKDLEVADVAIIDLYVHPEPGYKQKARAEVLKRHFRTIAFDKLRTEEQLAYAVGVTSRSIEDYAGIGLYIQSPVKGPKDIQSRFDSFKVEYAAELDKVTEETFAQLKNATLVGLKEKPKNLQAEVSPVIKDWYRENFNFDSKAKLIAEVEKVTLADVKDFYRESVGNSNAARLNIQLRGSKFKDTPFADLKGQTEVSNVEQFYKGIKFQ